MRVFEQVVVENGFAAGARKLGLPPATVTRLVKDLEDHLGVQLLQRSTRRLALTPAGEAYLDKVRRILSDIDEAEEAAHSHTHEMSGSVRVLALPGLATHLVAPAIAEFRREHPKVRIDLCSDLHASRGVEEHDLVLATDHQPLPADAVLRPLGHVAVVFCASPDYVQRHGVPHTPQALREHSLVRFVPSGPAGGTLRLLHEADPARAEEVELTPALTCNDHEAMLRSTLEGAGIGGIALTVAAPLLRSGQLLRVLSPWLAERMAVVAGFASRRHMPARTRAFLEHLAKHAAKVEAGLDAGAPDLAALAARPASGRAGSADRYWSELQRAAPVGLPQ